MVAGLSLSHFMIIFTQIEQSISFASCAVRQTSPKILKWNSQMKNKMTVFLIHFRRNATLYFDYIFVTLQMAVLFRTRNVYNIFYLSPQFAKVVSEYVSLCVCGWLYIFTSMCFFYIRIVVSYFVCLFVFYGSIFPVHFSTSSDLMWFPETDCITNNPRQR